MENLNFVALDFETATSDRSSICEIGLTAVNNGKIVESKSWLVKPEDNEYDSFNIYIHGITPNMTKNSHSFSKIWTEVEPYLQNKTVVAHNTGFDMYALRDALVLNNISFPKFDYFCSYRVAKYVVKNCYSYSLSNLCETLNIETLTHHRAESDSIACAEVFIKCIKLSGVQSLENLQNKYSFRKGEFDIDLFKTQRGINSSSSKSAIKNIIGDKLQIEEDSIFYNKNVCFTGSFKYGIRTNLLQKIADIGGIPTDSVTNKTDILVVGQQDFRVVGESGMSSKQKKAFDLLEKGKDIEIMSEEEFLRNI